MQVYRYVVNQSARGSRAAMRSWCSRCVKATLNDRTCYRLPLHPPIAHAQETSSVWWDCFENMPLPFPLENIIIVIKAHQQKSCSAPQGEKQNQKICFFSKSLFCFYFLLVVVLSPLCRWENLWILIWKKLKLPARTHGANWLSPFILTLPKKKWRESGEPWPEPHWYCFDKRSVSFPRKILF